jgi:hypothetical protein
MDDFRLDPVSPADAYRDRQPSGSGGRRKHKPAAEPAAGEDEDEVILVESAEPPTEGGVQDYYSPSPRTKPEE